MNLSAILVVVPVEKLESAIAELNALPGVEVHHTDPATGRLIVTQEAEDVGAEVEGLRRIKALPGIILAEMVQHCFEDDDEIAARARSGIAEIEGGGGVASLLED